MSKLKQRLGSMGPKSGYEISGEIEELINDYIYNKILKGTFDSSDFISKSETEIEQAGVYNDIQRISDELGSIIEKASKIACENYENYENY